MCSCGAIKSRRGHHFQLWRSLVGQVVVEVGDQLMRGAGDHLDFRRPIGRTEIALETGFTEEEVLEALELVSLVAAPDAQRGNCAALHAE